MTVIKPTVGRKVWFRPTPGFAAELGAGDARQPCDATILYVWGSRMVNLLVLGPTGEKRCLASMPLLQPGDAQVFVNSFGYAEWPQHEAASQKGDLQAPARQSVNPDEAGERLAVMADMLRGAPAKGGGAVSLDDAALEAEIKAKGLTAPRVTREDIEPEVVSTHYFTAAHGVLGEWLQHQHTARPTDDWAAQALGLLIFCVLVLRNGFTVTGEAACVSPENFDPAIGRRMARERAIAKVRMLEGYRLKQRLHDDPVDIGC